jgi:hypothetical protein
MTGMDSIKGAIALRARLADAPEPGPPAPVPEDAPPIFHWIAASREPRAPSSAASAEAAADATSRG